MAQEPTASQAVAAARMARDAGKLRVARRALDYACKTLDQDPGTRDHLAGELAYLARELAKQGAPISALSEWLRARDLGHSNGVADAVSSRARLDCRRRWTEAPGHISWARFERRATRRRGREPHDMITG